MSTSSIKNEPNVPDESTKQTSNESIEKPTSSKRKSDVLETSDSLETSQTNVSPVSNNSSSNLVTGREKRIRKIKAYDDDFLMYDMPSCSNSSLFQNLTKQMTPAQDVEVKYNLSDIVWAKVSGHPWWPCMISNPELSTASSIKNESKNDNSHFKLIGGSRPKRSYYVEFFGPSIEHAWVPEGNLIEYHGIEAFKTFTQQQIDNAQSRSAKDRLIDKYSLRISLPKREGWDQALSEADSFMNKKPRDRKIFFIKKHNNFESSVEESPEVGKVLNKIKRESIESTESVQSESKKPLNTTEIKQDTITSDLVEERHDYFIESSDIKVENPLKIVIKKKTLIDESEIPQIYEQLSPKSEQSTSTKTDELDDKTIFNLANKFDVENIEAPNSDSYLTDRYKNAAYHIRQGLSIDEVCNKYRISKSALIKYLERGTAPRGKKTRLTESEEKDLVDWLISYKELKYCDAINIVFDKVLDMFVHSDRKNPFPNGKPSVDWWYDFLSRHPQIMASKPDWIKRGKINDKYIQDVQSGQLKCTKFRRALLSAIQYIRKMGDTSLSIPPLSQNYDETSQESFKIKNETTQNSVGSKTSSLKPNDDLRSNEDSVMSEYDDVEYSLNSGLHDNDINKLLDSLASDESEIVDTTMDEMKKYEMKYLFVNNDDEDDYDLPNRILKSKS